MKKTYMKPAIAVVEMGAVAMLCVSYTSTSSYDSEETFSDGPVFDGEGDGEDY